MRAAQRPYSAAVRSASNVTAAIGQSKSLTIGSQSAPGIGGTLAVAGYRLRNVQELRQPGQVMGSGSRPAPSPAPTPDPVPEFTGNNEGF